MDGAQLLAEVKKRYPQVVRIILSGQLEQEMTLKSIPMAHQSLSKPCDVEVLKHTIEKTFALRDLLANESIKRIVSQIESLPSMPSVYTEIMEEVQSPDPSIKRVGEIISKDLAMTAKILQLVNSAFFGLMRQISSPQEAVILLGTETIKALVLSVKIFSQFDQKKFSRFSFDGLLNHGISVSLYASTITKEEKLDKNLINGAFMAGLLHDIGKLILATNFSEPYQEVLDEAQNAGQNLWDLENKKFGSSHAEIGAYLMGLWGLEYPVVEAIAFHHRPGKSITQDIGSLTAVHIGNALYHEALNSTEEDPNLRYDAGYLDRIGVTNRMPEWRQVCRELMERKG
jgi:putative nucleotidyltransferase with HDIG domain